MRAAALVAVCCAGFAPAQRGVVRSEFVFEKAPFPRCHASTIAESKVDGEGQLVAAWFGGKHEKSPDVGIWVSRRVGGEWTAPVEVADGVQFVDGQRKVHRHPCWNPVLFQPRPVDGKAQPLLLFYKCGPDPRRWWGMLTESADGGATFGHPRRLPEKIDGPVKNKPVQLPNGDILCASSTEYAGWRVHFERTGDLGRTWSRIGPIHDAKKWNAIQPSILAHGEGKLQVLCRSKEGRMVTSWSLDTGETWTKPEATDLPNPNSGTDAVTLRDGRHLLVYNHAPRRGPFPSGREVLNVAVSEDGRSWSAALVLERQKGEYSYPAVIQSQDGLVHVTYTWRRQRIKHVVLDPAKFELTPIVNGTWPAK